MDTKKELRKIKKMYGENFMKMCRELFPTILEHEGLLTKVLMESFSTNSPSLCEDIIENGKDKFKDYIYSKVDLEKAELKTTSKKTPYELLKEAGYDLYESTTEEEIQSFKRYYAEGEELCTFYGGRLKRCIVFWAVKENAEEIKREDYKEPKREDEYGTSVMGIQFNKTGSCRVSIKNRYNHTVDNSDATYGNDLDRIIPGLKQSFAQLLAERGLNLDDINTEQLQMSGYIVASDGKYYKYNKEINGIYYCSGNVIIDHGNVIKLEPEKKLLIDYFILDKENKTIQLYDEKLNDSFIDYFEDIEIIKDKKDKENGLRMLTIKTKKDELPIEIGLDENNSIISYKNATITSVANNFLMYNQKLSELELPNLQYVGDYFLSTNYKLRNLELLNLICVGDYFFEENEKIDYLKMPSLQRVGNNFLFSNMGLREIDSPNLQKAGVGFIASNYNNREFISQLGLPDNTVAAEGEYYTYNLEVNGKYYCEGNIIIDNGKVIKLKPEEMLMDYFILDKANKTVRLYDKEITDSFVNHFKNMDSVEEFEDKEKGTRTLKIEGEERPIIIELNRQGNIVSYKNENIKVVGDYFLAYSKELRRIELPNVQYIGLDFIWTNNKINYVDFRSLKKVGDNFLSYNQKLKELYLPNLEDIGYNFLGLNFDIERELKYIYLPKLDNKYLYNKTLIKLLEETQMAMQNSPITPQEILQLDEQLELTTGEVREAGKVVSRGKEKMDKSSYSLGP